jgi:nitroreductase
VEKKMYNNKTIQTIKQRRSVRNYKKEQLKQEELETILEAALYAPFGDGETQDVHFTVIQNKNILEQLNKMAKEAARMSDLEWFKELGNNKNYSCLYNAPVLIVLSCNKNSMCPEADASMAVQNMLLAAESIGVGACCLYFPLLAFDLEPKEKLLEELKISEEYRPVFSLILGYKEIDEIKIPEKIIKEINYIK